MTKALREVERLGPTQSRPAPCSQSFSIGVAQNIATCPLVTKDIKQASDTVWHTGMKYKIRNNFNLPAKTEKLLCSFLSDEKMRIKHTQTHSE
ncbi:hypothetical protein E2C01_070935 [Portunus trituberculatus]|uniref:Uncharacterized protein n=1 Tax=Portunus trituberculatus TaxID=210409 RepID=A0A5B7I3W1_PORTR|nr:hypothetical protein [Portunus trituberculatus]